MINLGLIPPITLNNLVESAPIKGLSINLYLKNRRFKAEVPVKKRDLTSYQGS